MNVEHDTCRSIYIQRARTHTNVGEFIQSMERNEHKRLSENETLNITLHLNTTNCTTLQDIIISIVKDKIDNIMCTILFELDTICTQTDTSNSCSCEGKSGTYMISRKMKRNDSGLWKFMQKINGKVKATYEINVTVNYPANVVRLEIDGQEAYSSYTLIRNRNTSIVCVWENGNPSVTARLLNHRRKVLGNEANKDIIYTHKANNCNDYTSLMCEADGSRKNLSVILLTICPPAFVNASPTPVISTNTFTFPVRAHTTNISECSLYRQTQLFSISELEDECPTVSKASVENVLCSIKSTTATFDTESSLDNHHQGKRCSCSLEGTVPHLNITLLFHKFTEPDDGEWILMLSNDGGCDAINFTLHLSVISTMIGIEEPRYLVILAVTMASIILIAVFIIIFTFKKKGNMGFMKSQKHNKSVEYKSPSDHQINGDITMVVNGMNEVSEECVSPAALSPKDGVHRSEGTVVGINDIYARVMKKTQGHADIDLNTEPEGTQSFNNHFYEVVSAKKEMDAQKLVKDTIEEVIKYENPFYGIKNCTLDDQNIKSDPRRNGSSLDAKGETSFTISTDTYNLSDNIDECSQTPVLHIQNLAEARHNTYLGVSIQRQDTRVFQRSAQPLTKVQE